jgi:hypothetical protein
MVAFDFVLLLLSFVFALALTHLLSRVGSLLLARKQTHFSALQTLVIVNAVVLTYVNWLALWYLRGIKEWDLPSITVFFAFALSTFFFCAAAAPDVTANEPADLEQFYWENYRLFYGFIVLQTVVALLTNFVFLKTPFPALFFWTNIDTLPFFLPPVLALTFSRRWAQWVAGLGLLALSVWWLITFSSTLR